MEGGVSPPVEVDPGKDAGLAGNPRVDLVVRQHHRVHLQRVNRAYRSWMGKILNRGPRAFYCTKMCKKSKSTTFSYYKLQ